MGLKTLCAGCSTEERMAIEASVRAGVGARPPQERWLVSLVKQGDRWSVTVNGPGTSRSFVAPSDRLESTIAEVVRPGSPAGGTAKEPPARNPQSQTVSHSCDACRRLFVVIYEVEPGEPTELAPAACPHCWRINRVEIAASARWSKDYRVDRA